jgi:subtilisin family serine protease
MTMRKRLTPVLYIFIFFALLTQTLYAGTPEAEETSVLMAGEDAAPIIAADLLAAMEATTSPAETLPVIVTLKEQVNLQAFDGLARAERNEQLVTALQALAHASQAPIRAFLEIRSRAGTVDSYTSFWVFNGLAVTATPEVIQEMGLRREVLRITADETIPAPESSTTSLVEPNLDQVNAPAMWDLGFRGQGIVVASLDSGVYAGHPDLSAQWRGGSNSWFDPYGQHPISPYDSSGHGTQTMGVIVGRDLGGTAIGVAPDAQWIAAKIFDDAGNATTSAIHSAFQWLLDPDGNPATDDAPHIANNSWGYATPGCNLEFQLDLQALRAAGIVPVFSAGNAGPNPETSVSPANNPEALAVGGVDGNDRIYLSSSRGPSACDGVSVFPDLVAPAVEIWTSNWYGSYSSGTGTSLAAPHVSGALALLLSAFGDLAVSEQEAALLSTETDLGPAGPDNDFGYGRLDVLAAFYALQGSEPTATPAPTATSNPTPTATATATGTPTPTATATNTATATPTSPPLTNVALGRPVTVSSFADESHDGAMAVDGDPLTSWQTKKAVGKKTLASEWIVVDLGESLAISQVELKWDLHYATHYSVQLSPDQSAWTTVFATSTGDGGNDTIAFEPVMARYVKLESTVWSDSSLRNWLQEFEVYGEVGDLPSPTATPDAAAGLHIGDLEGSAAATSRTRWSATVLITVHGTDELPAGGATVSGAWDGGAAASTCVTDSYGQCSVTQSDIKSNQASANFSVTGVLHPSHTYQDADNHDPDGDSDGTTITIMKP